MVHFLHLYLNIRDFKARNIYANMYVELQYFVLAVARPKMCCTFYLASSKNSALSCTEYE